MIQLPDSLDYQAITILLEAFRGKNNDVEEIAVASWNIAGYGLHLGLPVFIRQVSNPLNQGNSEETKIVDEIEGFLADPELKKGVLSSAAIMFLIKLAVKYLLA
tara:strand:- start:2007 stop:2318 length:312 start_codon:yes stop_codon:yes gene_type:complete